MTECERCKSELILCPADWPWNEDFDFEMEEKKYIEIIYYKLRKEGFTYDKIARVMGTTRERAAKICQRIELLHEKLDNKDKE